jgi:hypothetical protein
MLSLLETLLTFVGVMLVLALAAQSLQELVKSLLALKGQAAPRGLKGLVQEAQKWRSARSEHNVERPPAGARHGYPERSARHERA